MNFTDNLKKILNEDQDPKSIEKITTKLESLLLNQEEIGYIAVQKKPAITVFPDSVVVTNKRLLICKPKNLGLSIEVIDHNWKDIAGVFIKENILGTDFSFSTHTNSGLTIDYLPKNQARKLYTFSKNQIDAIQNPVIAVLDNSSPIETTPDEILETVAVEEVVNYAELIPTQEIAIQELVSDPDVIFENIYSKMSKDQLFEKLQNHKKLLDNGLILQGEYDALKKEILPFL
jgi:hypothetical protein